MRKKELKYLVTFHTTTGAMAMEQYCRENQVPGRLIPVPRQISAGCGMAWCAPLEEREKTHKIVKEQGMDMEGEYEMFL